MNNIITNHQSIITNNQSIINNINQSIINNNQNNINNQNQQNEKYNLIENELMQAYTVLANKSPNSK